VSGQFVRAREGRQRKLDKMSTFLPVRPRARGLEEVIAARAKANQSLSEGRGHKGSQKSADLNPIETREEIAKLAGCYAKLTT
jgi:hypothetical protein